MKSDNVQRGIRARRGRSEGDAPSLGRVGRMSGSGIDNGRMGDERRYRNGKAAKLITIGWSVALAVFALALLSGTFAWWLVARANKPAQVYSERPAFPTVEEEEGEMDFVLTRPHPDEIVRLATRALEVDSVALVNEFIHTEGREAGEVLAYMQGLRGRDGTPGKPVPLLDPDVNGLMIQNALVTFTHPDGKSRNRIMILTPDEAGAWKMDFAAFARLADPPWEDFVSGEARTVVGRVFVQRDHYYNGSFSSEQRWSAYAMASPDLEDLMIGYCLVGSSTERALNSLCARQKAPVRVTVQIRHVHGAERRQFAIDRLVAEDWIIRGPDFEDRFK